MQINFVNTQSETFCKEWLTISEAFAALSAGGVACFSLATFRKLVKGGALPFETAPFLGRWYCRRPELLAFVAQAGGSDPSRGSQPAGCALLSFPEAAQILQAAGLSVSLDSLRKAYRENRLPLRAFKIGGRLYFYRSELLAFVAQAPKQNAL